MVDPSWEPSEIERFFTEAVAKLSRRHPRFVDSGTSIGEAIRVLQGEEIGSVLVRDAAGRLIGIFTERDVLRRVLLEDIDPEKTQVDDVMTTDPETLEDSATVAMALNKMHLGHYRHLPLVDDAGLPVGFISIKDLVAYLARRLSALEAK